MLMMSDTPTAFAFIAVGMVLAIAGDWCWQLWNRAENNKARAEAEKVLEVHGLTAYTYLASMGTENAELRSALDRFAFTGQVVLDKSGNVVGRVLPKAVKGSHLRLVVDNTK